VAHYKTQRGKQTMKLTLNPSDLSRVYQTVRGDVGQVIPTHRVSFEKLSPEAQAAVRVVGRAIFHSWDEKTFVAVFPPKE